MGKPSDAARPRRARVTLWPRRRAGWRLEIQRYRLSSGNDTVGRLAGDSGNKIGEAEYRALTQPLPADRMQSRPVSRYVSNSRHEGPSCHDSPAAPPPELAAGVKRLDKRLTRVLSELTAPSALARILHPKFSTSTRASHLPFSPVNGGVG